MGDSEEKPLSAPVPEAQPEPQHDNSTAPQPEAQLDVARRFLDDDEVKSAPREKKAEFLRAKGIAESDIKNLLEETQDAPDDIAVSCIPPVSSTLVVSLLTLVAGTSQKQRGQLADERKERYPFHHIQRL